MFDGLDLKIMGMTAVIFVLMLVTLNDMLYRPILRQIQQRRSLMQEDMQTTNEAEQVLAEHRAMVQEVFKAARAEAEDIKNKANRESKITFEEQVLKFHAALEEKRSVFLRELAAKEEAFKNELEAEFRDFKFSLGENNQSA